MPSAPPSTTSIDERCVNTIRGLAIDAVEAAKSGHPGLPLGAAPMAHVLWTRHLRHNPANPSWPNRDRFILSAGHGSMLLYSLLHLTGYGLTLEDLKNFRQFDSKTPGHPENFMTPGIEVTTGPLGQGCAMSVGMALAERHLGALYNRTGHQIVDHRTYVLCSDGDLMEGVASEAASLAGHQRLGKLIWLYDDNGITIDGSTHITFSENVQGRFEALGWHVTRVDGMDVDAVDRALAEAKREVDRPSLIMAKTIIGFGSPNKGGTSKCHGSALGPEEARLTKEALDLPLDQPFYVPDDVREEYSQVGAHGREWEADWREAFRQYLAEYPGEAASFDASGRPKAEVAWPVFTEADKLATRAASGKVLNALAESYPTLVGGSADLAESNNTVLSGSPAMQPDSPQGRNIAFGVREHAMAAACNGMTLHGGCRAFGASFLIFSDYCRPAIRLAALQRCPSIFVFTHDSIGVGEDGPTHQPIEHLASLRAIPNLNVMRPADGNEVAACWKAAMDSESTPGLLALTRQAVPTLSPPMSDGVHPALCGAYVLSEAQDSKPAVVLIGTGSEVQLCVQAKQALEAQGIAARVVSMPSWFLFEKQTEAYRTEVLPKGVPAVSVEAGSTLGWSRYAQAHVGIDHFGASAPAEELYRAFGITAEEVAKAAIRLLD